MNDITPEPAQVYLQLRNLMINLDPVEVGLAPSSQAPLVWGVLMETGYPVGCATLLSLVDGTTSLYYSTGGGMLGSGDYTPVAEASKALVTEAENHTHQLTPGTEFPLPMVGFVRFIVLTYSGKLTGEALEENLEAGAHSLSPLFQKAHETLNQLRLLADKKRVDHRE